MEPSLVWALDPSDRTWPRPCLPPGECLLPSQVFSLKVPEHSANRRALTGGGDSGCHLWQRACRLSCFSVHICYLWVGNRTWKEGVRSVTQKPSLLESIIIVSTWLKLTNSLIKLVEICHWFRVGNPWQFVKYFKNTSSQTAGLNADHLNVKSHLLRSRSLGALYSTSHCCCSGSSQLACEHLSLGSIMPTGQNAYPENTCLLKRLNVFKSSSPRRNFPFSWGPVSLTPDDRIWCVI